MASGKSTNSHSALRANVQIKTEPGSSVSTSSESTLLRNIKMEPGLPTATTQRLTSFRLPRDLTLGGNVKVEKPKKIYTPNINAQRNKKKDEAIINKVESVRLRDGGSRGHGRGRGRGDRGRGRGNLVQSVGVWSEGINTPLASRKYPSSSGSSSTETKKYLEKPKLNLNKIINTEEEEEKVKNLLRDNIMEDGANDNDVDFVTVPMVKQEKLFKMETRLETSNAHSDKEDTDKKPFISETGEVIDIKKEEKLKTEIPSRDSKEDLYEQVASIIDNKSNSYVLMRLPRSLLGLESNKEEPEPKLSNNSRSNNHNESESTASTLYCNLNHVKAGPLGKLQILKSGNMKLCIGENNIDVKIGLPYSIRRELLAAKIDTLSSKGNLINLGPVTNDLSCTLDMESLVTVLEMSKHTLSL